jgi:hypothetical protein
MKKINHYVEFIYIDLLKHKIKVFREDKKLYFRLPEDTKNCRRDLHQGPNKRYLKFVEGLVG